MGRSGTDMFASQCHLELSSAGMTSEETGASTSAECTDGDRAQWLPRGVGGLIILGDVSSFFLIIGRVGVLLVPTW